MQLYTDPNHDHFLIHDFELYEVYHTSREKDKLRYVMDVPTLPDIDSISKEELIEKLKNTK